MTGRAFHWAGAVLLASLPQSGLGADSGLVTMPSKYSVHETIERFEAAIRAKSDQGWMVFTELDHAAAAAKSGLTLPPRTVIVFAIRGAAHPICRKRRPSPSTYRRKRSSGKTTKGRSGSPSTPATTYRITFTRDTDCRPIRQPPRLSKSSSSMPPSRPPNNETVGAYRDEKTDRCCRADICGRYPLPVALRLAVPCTGTHQTRRCRGIDAVRRQSSSLASGRLVEPAALAYGRRRVRLCPRRRA